MTLIQASILLGVTPDTLRQQIANGRLRATKRGRDWWVTKGEVARYGKENRRMQDHFAKPLIERGIPVKPWRCAVCGKPLKRTNGPGMGATFRH